LWLLLFLNYYYKYCIPFVFSFWPAFLLLVSKSGLLRSESVNLLGFG
jgi:hypothetical protein